MNKQEFVNYIANEYGCTKTKAEKVIDTFISSVIGVMGQGNEISLQGFGQFYTIKINARMTHDPRNGQPVNIPQQNIPKFSAGQKLKNACR